MARLSPFRLIEEAGDNPVGAEFLAEIADGIAAFALEVKESLARIEVQLQDPIDTKRLFTNGSHPEALIRRVEVVTAGTAVQGPSIPIPDGVVTVIRQRRSTGTRNGYIAVNEHDVSSTQLRTETQNADVVGLRVSNWNKLWFDAGTSGTEFELIAEQ